MVHVRQWLVLIVLAATLGVNYAATALPLGGMDTGAISDLYDVAFTPANYVFAIWGVIYLGMLLYAGFQLQRYTTNLKRFKTVGWLFIVGSLANTLWIILWHNLEPVWTLLPMLTLLGTLIWTYVALRDPREKNITQAELWLVRVPFSIYLGWVSVATIANVSIALWVLEWSAFGIADENWSAIMIGVATLLALTMAIRHRDLAYVLVIIWAVAGIIVKFSSIAIIASAGYMSVGILTVVAIVLLYRGTHHLDEVV